MPKHTSAQAAKEFLVAQISEEAQRQSVPLSEVERKMLYFSETGWTLPDIWDVSDEFDRDYDQAEYEKKIAALVQGVDKRLRLDNRTDYESWRRAIETLRKGDHYLLVMIDLAGGGAAGLRPPGDQLKLFLTALAITVGLVAGFFAYDTFSQKYGIDLSKYISGEKIFFSIWAVAASLAATHYVVRWIFGAAAANKILDKAFSLFDRSASKEK